MRIQYLDDVEEFIESLEAMQIAKVGKTVELLEELGNTLSMPHSKPLGGGLFELRIHGDESVRIFYCFQNGCALLLHAVKKKSQAIPAHELATARKKLALLASL